MASTDTLQAAAFTSSSSRDTGLLVSLPSLPDEALQSMLANLALAFAGESISVATPDPAPPDSTNGPHRLIPYTPSAPASAGWVLSATDYIDTYKLAQETQATSCLLLGPESQSLTPHDLRALATPLFPGAGTRLPPADLSVPHYSLSPREGLVNSAILYPVTRALFGTCPRYPLAIDLGLSLRMIQRLAAISQKCTAAGQGDAILWPVSEAASASFHTAEAAIGHRSLPQPTAPDLNALLAQIAGSLFADVDSKAAFWQRARAVPTFPTPPSAEPGAGYSMPDVTPMLEAFRLAYTNLHEIWSLVLPPNSLLGLKKMSLLPPTAFRMPDALWVRIVYDFILAYRLRTLNRGHLLGALTPLYLAWVASHILLADAGTAPEKHIEAQALSFEADKPYLVSRWRWPDRFNP